jgi:hypothetical protein
MTSHRAKKANSTAVPWVRKRATRASTQPPYADGNKEMTALERQSKEQKELRIAT